VKGKFLNQIYRGDMKQLAIKGGISIIPMSISGMAWAQQTGRYYDHNMMWGSGIFGWLLGGFMMLLFIALATVVIMAVIRAFGGQKRHIVSADNDENIDAINILKKRFASGEIDKEEFEKTKELLEK